MTTNNVVPLKFKTVPILPTVYGDSLSYMEQVARVTQKINEVIEALNSLSEITLSECKVYVDDKISDLQSVLEECVHEVKQIQNGLNQQYIDFTNQINTQVLSFNKTAENLSKKFDISIQGVNDRTDLAIQQNNDYILSHLSKFLSQIKVLNFFTGEVVGLQDMIDYLSILHIDNGLDYNELMAKNLTFNALNNLGISYTNFVLNGSTVF